MTDNLDDKAAVDAFKSWVDPVWIDNGRELEVGFRKGFAAGEAYWRGKERESIIAIAQEEKRKHLDPDGSSDDPDYDQGYSEAAQDLARLIAEQPGVVSCKFRRITERSNDEHE